MTKYKHRTEWLLEQQPPSVRQPLHTTQPYSISVPPGSCQNEHAPTSTSETINDKIIAVTRVNTRPFLPLSSLSGDPLSSLSGDPQSQPIAAAMKPSIINQSSTRKMSSTPQSSRSSTSTTSQHKTPSIKQKKTFRTYLPRKFRFRPKRIEGHDEEDSFKNKTAKFSNERTMLIWMNVTVNLGSLSLMLLSFGTNSFTPYVGVALLVVCLSMLIYSVTTFQVRMEWLNMGREDVVYYDRWTPSLITLALFATYALNLTSKAISTVS